MNTIGPYAAYSAVHHCTPPECAPRPVQRGAFAAAPVTAPVTATAMAAA